MKTKKITSFLLCCLLLSFTISCKKDSAGPGGGNCENLSSDYVAKVNAFTSVQSKATCTAVVTSLGNLVNKCTILTAAQRKEYNDTMADFDCTVYP